MTFALHCLWCQLLIDQLGSAGAGLSLVIFNASNNLLIILFLYLMRNKQDYFSQFSLKFTILRQTKLIKSYIQSSLPIMFHIYLEFFAFFYLSFVAMTLGNQYMNAQNAIVNGAGICFRVAMSLSLSVMAYLGYEMGRKNISQAKKYSVASCVIILVFAVIVSILLFYLKQQWADFYTNSEDVKQILLEAIPFLVAGFIIID